MKKQYITIKKQLVTVSFIILSFCTFSQNNLQFSSVLLEEFTHNSTLATAVGSVNVPAGHVLKITSASQDLVNSQSRNYGKLTVGGFALTASSGLNNTVNINFPVWFPAGTYVVKAENFNTNPVIYKISGIQFKVVSI